uniref:Reverse transcriptase domain-containing protein n=1 Tax=Monodelphis domestica TaxID=13616 RepID=A0A5F8H2C2_MONDO
KPPSPSREGGLNFADTPQTLLLSCPLSEEYLLTTQASCPELSSLLQEFQARVPGVWAESNPPGLAAHQPPVVVQLLSSTTPVRVRQYSISQQAREGISIPIQRLLEAGILVPCQSPWNTPLLPVQKPGTLHYCPVQDLREVNKRIETVHPTVPKPYTLLSQLPPEHTVYTVLDLKDAFFSIPLALIGQPIFAFEDPAEGKGGQITWSQIPQGFKNSPSLFGEALGRDLSASRESHSDVTLLQYVDDLLLATPSAETCKTAPLYLLQLLGTLGYRVSAKKAQLCTTSVTYLGDELGRGCEETLLCRDPDDPQYPRAQNQAAGAGILGDSGVLQAVDSRIAEIAKPLYAATAGKLGNLDWTEDCQRAFNLTESSLGECPGLRAPKPV